MERFSCRCPGIGFDGSLCVVLTDASRGTVHPVYFLRSELDGLVGPDEVPRWAELKLGRTGYSVEETDRICAAVRSCLLGEASEVVACWRALYF